MRAVVHDATLLRVVLLAFATNVLVMPYLNLMPVFARDELHIGSSGLGLLLACVGSGTVVGALWVAHSRRLGEKPLLHAATAAAFALLVLVFALGFAFENRPYPATDLYRGAYQFKKHFFGSIGELDGKGEEFECAKLLDTLPQVKYWIRNLSNRPQTSFWLPTSTDRFYGGIDRRILRCRHHELAVAEIVIVGRALRRPVGSRLVDEGMAKIVDPCDADPVGLGSDDAQSPFTHA